MNTVKPRRDAGREGTRDPKANDTSRLDGVHAAD